jgi:CubicO group peptidase (beta-lactamase class C family)
MTSPKRLRNDIFVFFSLLILAACQTAAKSSDPVIIGSDELGAFADDFFPNHMEDLHIPGLSFVFVQGGEVIYAKGYGYARLEHETPMDPTTTILGIGSVSKPFVATAVMQLVEQGKLDLYSNINQYLSSFQLENSYSEPVTLAHLLTHKAGFEDPPYVRNTDPEQVPPLAEYLAENIPPRPNAPGEVHRYSNYGYALAAFIVEEKAGIPFDQYVDKNIFQPLGMDKSSYLLSPPLPETLATGYQQTNGEQVPQPLDYDGDYPAGSIFTTAEDMTHFILAHLQDGCYMDGCILGADSLEAMHQKQAETPYEGQAVTFGFTEGTFDKARMIGHSGATGGFGSILDMLPDHGMGYFFSFNEECHETDACQIISEFRTAFLEQFLE